MDLEAEIVNGPDVDWVHTIDMSFNNLQFELVQIRFIGNYRMTKGRDSFQLPCEASRSCKFRATNINIFEDPLVIEVYGRYRKIIACLNYKNNFEPFESFKYVIKDDGLYVRNNNFDDTYRIHAKWRPL